MFKVLLRKNMLEIKEMYFRDKKKGGSLSGAAKGGMVLLYIFLYILLAASFAAMASLFYISGNDSTYWIGWSVMGVIAVAAASIINALTSYSHLYLARDNELLLSMPIHPGDILKSRMVSVYIMGLIYVSMVWIPTLVVAVIMHAITPAQILPALVLMLIVGVAVLALTCFFGWLVALLSVKFKNQKILWVIVSIAFIGGLYYFQYKSNQIFSSIADNMEHAGEVIEDKLWPFYILGHAADGNSFAYLCFTLMAFVLIALAYLLLSKTFIKVTTTKTAGNNAKFSNSQIKSMSLKKALRKKEWGRIFSSVTVMLNQGLSVIIMILGAAILFIKGDVLEDKIVPVLEIVPEFAAAAPLIVIIVLAMLQSMAITTAASISLEGNKLWMLQTLPVEPYEVLRAKMDLGIELQGLPAILLAWAAAEALNFNVSTVTAVVFFAASYASLSNAFGLMLNLKHCRFDWTSETTVVKQGFAITVSLFGGWLFAMVIGGGGFLLRNAISPDKFILAVDVLLYVGYYILNNWLKKTGAETFRYL